MGRYASATDVGTDRSRAEIERTLKRYGARSFMYGWNDDCVVLGFVVSGRQVRFVLPVPSPDNPEFTRTPTGRERSKPAAKEAHEQAARQRWRALALVIEAKLEAVESGIVSFDAEFMAHLVLPSGETVGDVVTPRIAEAYQTGVTPPLLPTSNQRAIVQ